ncbi:MAG: ORF6N domain-containing protein, partial [Gemmatimonadaceae bacterium]|nr:ORF6N domain-containing protein [Chitinophagaceae bacterium]
QAVRRNIARFPSDFMFEMDARTFQDWRSQFVISNPEMKMAIRHPPFCFTEEGITMLSCVLNSQVSIEVNIQVIRIFGRFRQAVIYQKDILSKIAEIEKSVSKHSHELSIIFETLKQMINNPPVNRVRVGFRRSEEKD